MKSDVEVIGRKDVRCQRSEVSSTKFEDGSQKSEVRSIS